MFRWLVTIESVDKDNSPVTLRFSDGRFSREGKPYFPRILQPGLYRFGMYAGGLLSTDTSGFGETVLINNDGNLEHLADYAIDGRSVKIERVNNDKTVTRVFSGTAMGFSFSGNEVVVRLRDPREPLEEDHPHDTYQGNNVLPNGLEGVEEDLKGTPKPQVFGSVVNAEPPSVNTARLIYQVSSLSDCTVTAVYDNGADLEIEATEPSLSSLESSTPSPGKARRFGGYFKLGSTPIGQVTCDATTASDLAGDVMRSICNKVGLSVCEDCVQNINSAGSVGYYLDSQVSTNQLIDELCDSIGAYWRIGEDGKVYATLLDPPEDYVPKTTIRPFMVSEADRHATGTGENGLPVWKVEIKADRIVTTQSQVAGSVSTARASRLSSEYRTAIAESAQTKSRHPLSKPYVYESWMRRVSEASLVCSRLLELFSVRRDRVSIEVQVSRQTDIFVGDVISLEYPRFGYTSPRNMIVLGVELDASDKIQRLDLWG